MYEVLVTTADRVKLVQVLLASAEIASDVPAKTNHYHFLFLPQHGLDLGKFMKRLNGSTAHQLNGLDNTRGRTVWYTYWDTCIRGEHDFWTRFNYIHYNPVKHGYVQQPEDWLFSSYRQYISDNEVWMKECAQEFPITTLFDNDKF